MIRATAASGWRLTRLSERLQSSSGSATAGPLEKTLVGEREVEWAWTLAYLRRGPGRVLDFGSGNGLLALAASFAGNESVAIDLEPEQYPFRGHEIEYIRGDFNEVDFDPESFDQILNCSSIEHVGVAGRFGATGDPEGDLRAMEKMARVLKPGGNMVLSIPLGIDAVHAPWHRVYGEGRLPQLFEHWEIQAESYWAKVQNERYEPVTREHALAEQGSDAYYALGLYVLTPR